ncbi:MAG: glycosyltransferase [candidate division KSB1 bacterium]|nr:glycosyltransferase [candidate division KSB1 bacterium]MDZ7276063.1 glycosyltransferase [candidate division KSB1 bacterium]MDZ7285655.1 glycosyltransferase [candidate division KSB1 bacterium]MDZ7298687.1 glycosyltransferase [candidate division KSB1 bacterium]MDZ7308405.1 glycosyltransferase [candidate division KSB1 bacterium]
MRILFINSIRMFGGGEVWMLRTLQALAAAGHQVWLCCRPATALAACAAARGIPLKLLSFRSDFDPLQLCQLACWMKRHDFDVVLTNMDKELRLGGLAARLAGVPAIIPRRGIDYPLKNRWRYRFAYNVLATHVLANSQATKAALLRHAPWLAPERISVIYNGIDPAEFAAADGTSLRKKWQLPADAPVLGFVGQLDERKGLTVLLAAFAKILPQVPAARLVLVGEGPLRTMIESERQRQGWQQHLLLAGFVDDIPAVMAAIDVLLLPSFWEGFGLVLIEAMAAGKPVITTNISSMPEIVEHGLTGFLLPPGDAGALAAHACALLQDGEQRRAMGEAARRRVAGKFSHALMMQQLETLFAREARRKTWRRR